MSDSPYAGVFAATLCAFHEDFSIDEEGLRSFCESNNIVVELAPISSSIIHCNYRT